jgi:hypothetical protein
MRYGRILHAGTLVAAVLAAPLLVACAPADIAAQLTAQGWRNETPAATGNTPATARRFGKHARAVKLNLVHTGDVANLQLALLSAG